MRQIVRLIDTFTNLQNRLRVVTNTTEELSTATEALFRISQRTRSSFASTAEVFSRVSLATRELGVSQKQTLEFTESLNQAVILSGATTQEATAGLIQLSQGLGSGALRGQELVAVLEGIPVVADVIAEHLGVTRGQLRALGAQGKLTAEIILDAFEGARESLAERFGKAVVTIGQSFQLLENSFIRTLGEIDLMTGASEVLAGAIISISQAVDEVVYVLPLLASNLDLVAQTGAALLFALAAPKLAAIGGGVGVISAAFRGLNVVLRLSIVLARTLTRAFVVFAIIEGIILLEERFRTFSQILDIARRNLQDLWDTLSEIPLPTLTGTQAFIGSIPAILGEVADSFSTAFSAGTTSNVSAINRLWDAISSVPTSAIDRASRAFDKIFSTLGGIGTRVIRIVARAFENFWQIIRNLGGRPVQILESALGNLWVAIRSIGVSIIEGIGDAFSDVGTAFLDLGNSGLEVVGGHLGDVWTAISAFSVPIIEDISDSIQGLGLTITDYFANLFDRSRYEKETRAFIELARRTQTQAEGTSSIPPQDVATITVTGDAGERERAFKLNAEQVKGLEALRDRLDKVRVAEDELTLTEILLRDAVKAGNIGKDEASRLLGLLRREYEKVLDPVGVSQRLLEEEIALRNVSIKQRVTERERLEFVHAARERNNELTSDEINDLYLIEAARQRNLEVLQREEAIYDDLVEPAANYEQALNDINSVLAKHPELSEQARIKQIDLKLQFLDTQTTFSAGFERGLLRVGQSFNDFGALAEQAVTGWATAAEDVLVNFVRTGKLSFKDLIDSILADLARLAVRKFITGPIADLLGLGSGGKGGDIFSGIGSSIARSIGGTALGEALAGTAVGDFLGIGAAGASAAASLAAAGTVAGTAVAAAGSSTVIGLAGAGVTAAGTLAVAGSTAATGFAGAGAAAAAGITTAGGTIGAGIASAGSSISAGIASAGSSAATAIGTAAAALGPLAIAVAGIGAVSSFFSSRRAKKSRNRINTLVSYVDQEKLTPQGTQRLSEILASEDSEEQLRRAIRLPRRPTNYAGRGSPSQSHREAVRRYNSRIAELRNNPVTFNTGGYVRGSGTGTSDSIMARISNGEFVVNASATRGNLPLLQSINDNAPRFQTGGLVESRAQVAAPGGTRVIVNDYRSQESPLASVRSVRRGDGGEDWIVEVRDAFRSGELDSAVDDRFGVKPVAA